jgi:hypothetical protein
MGKAGHEHVRKNFLITRYLRDYLRIFKDQQDARSGNTAGLQRTVAAAPGVVSGP